MEFIKRFVFNSFAVNTLLVIDESRKCIIVDPACSNSREESELSEYIDANNLHPVMMINSHFHVDHIIGNKYVCNKYDLTPVCHKESKLFWEMASEFGSVFGFEINNTTPPTQFVEDGEIITFGNTNLKVLYTPGHADGSICLLNEDKEFVITGDVLFRDSIGRTDLPTGNFDILMESIKNRLFTLPNNFIVYPGHGPQTTIGYEKENNPFVN